MALQRNLLTVLGCSSSLALMLSVAPSALASPIESGSSSDESTLSTLTQGDNNPIEDALSCSCARCVMGRVANL
ncbi:MAG: hypothetical protein F6K11_02065 [Leptolyngbya sp. SIO3F4]|nr:hypothetical protein [Leptolyngbya sp. SIO3F4]